MNLEFYLKLLGFNYNEKAQRECKKKIAKFLKKNKRWKYNEEKVQFISPKGKRYSLLLLLLKIPIDKIAE